METTKPIDTKYTIPDLLLGDDNAKTKKGRQKGWLTGILYLAPSDSSGVMNTCPSASKGCRAACLFFAGMAVAFPRINLARINKTKYLNDAPIDFIDHIKSDIKKLIHKAKANNEKLCIRLNGTSDLPFYCLKGSNGKSCMEEFPLVQFYDYTKRISFAQKYASGELPQNYHITFSRSESNQKSVDKVTGLGVNVAAVFLGKELPAVYKGRKVVNGDANDLRFLDESDVVVGLLAKGALGKKDKTGFCISLAE